MPDWKVTTEMKLSITLNGEERQFEVAANITLLSLLRNQAGCFSVKHGCESGECGACAVILEGRIVNSCILLAAQADEREVLTVEGLPWVMRNLKAASDQGKEPAEEKPVAGSSGERLEAVSASRSSFQNPDAFSREDLPSGYETLHPIQQAFVDTHAIQCGYCTPGMILSILALFAEKGLIELPSAKRRMRTASVRKKVKSKARPPSEQDIRDSLAGNLCRCTGYVKPVQAVRQAAEKLLL